MARPNFLFFLPDQHRPNWVPWNADLPLRMPNLERIAERGVRFSRAMCPSPLCAPSRACLASGREYDRCGVPNNQYDYPLEQPTYYGALRDAGYRVAGVGKFDLHKATLDWGLDGSRLLSEWGFTEGIDNEGKMDAIASYTGVRGGARTGGGTHHATGGSTPRAGGADHASAASSPPRGPKGPYMSFLQSRGLAETHVEDYTGRRGEHGHHLTHTTPLPDDAYGDNWIAENGLRFLRGFPADQPWHLVVNFTGPHSPMDVTESMRKRWADARFPPPVAASTLDPETHNAVRQNYAAMLENIDSQIGRFLALVEERGELDRTVIVYSSDHGEMLGDHDRWGKNTYYQPSAGVPLVVSAPGMRGGAESNALVSMHDLTATFLELAGVPALPEMDSRSLVSVLTGQSETHRPHVRSGLDRWRLVYDGRYKLVRQAAGDGESESRLLLFDLEADPHETNNVTPTHPEVVARLTPLLEPLA